MIRPGISRQQQSGCGCIRGIEVRDLGASRAHHVAASCAAVAFLPLHPLREAARLKGLRSPRAVVGASSLAAAPVTTRSAGPAWAPGHSRSARPPGGDRCRRSDAGAGDWRARWGACAGDDRRRLAARRWSQGCFRTRNSEELHSATSGGRARRFRIGRTPKARNERYAFSCPDGTGQGALMQLSLDD